MTLVIVIVVAIVCATVVGGMSALRTVAVDPLDTEREERWFIAHAPSRLRQSLRYLDKRVVGGAGVVIVLTILLATAAVVGWIFDGLDEGGGFARWDESAAEWGASHATERSTDVLHALTQLGATTWLLAVMAVLALVDYWRHRDLNVVWFLAIVGVGVTLLNNGLKWLVERERPAISQLTGFGGSSFPSGHSAAAAACWAAIALVLTRHSKRRLRALAAALAALIAAGVATSRVLLGVHWLTDVIAGVVVGWAWFLFVTILFGGRILRLGEPAERLAAGRTTPSTADRRELAVGQ
jgi:membrane-associated phospholipid phosphatase